ncbi:MAG: PIG-L family deacetylase [Gammaproteobacteria bacterium]
MQHLDLASGTGLGRLLCLGAHCDDIEIGCGGTVLELLARHPDLHVDWVVFTSSSSRAAEARASAAGFLTGARSQQVTIHEFRDGYLPFEGAALKDCFESLKATVSPDLILTHHRGDFHQDHRLVGEMTWNTWRNHLILEYEIPKYDGDLGRPNAYVPVAEATAHRKIELILGSFASQLGKAWFTADTFRALLRLRGVEANAPEGLAEAFFAPKIRLRP